METLRLKSHGIYVCICKSSRTEAFDIALLSGYVIVFVRIPGKSVTVKEILSRFRTGLARASRKEAKRGEKER